MVTSLRTGDVCRAKGELATGAFRADDFIGVAGLVLRGGFSMTPDLRLARLLIFDDFGESAFLLFDTDRFLAGDSTAGLVFATSAFLGRGADWPA